MCTAKLPETRLHTACRFRGGWWTSGRPRFPRHVRWMEAAVARLDPESLELEGLQTTRPAEGSTTTPHTARADRTESAGGLHTGTCMPGKLHGATRGSPSGEVAVHSARELSLGCIPLVSRLEGDVGGSVVDDCEGAHPEVVPAAATGCSAQCKCFQRSGLQCRLAVSGALRNHQLARVEYEPCSTIPTWPCATVAAAC